MIRVWMLLLPWLMRLVDDLIAYGVARNKVKRCGGMQGRNIRCEGDEA